MAKACISAMANRTGTACRGAVSTSPQRRPQRRNGSSGRRGRAPRGGISCTLGPVSKRTRKSWYKNVMEKNDDKYLIMIDPSSSFSEVKGATCFTDHNMLRHVTVDWVPEQFLFDPAPQCGVRSKEQIQDILCFSITCSLYLSVWCLRC